MLFPVRVDVTSKDGSVRLTDSMLIDPTCLPIPPCPKLNNNYLTNGTTNTTNTLWNDIVESNAKYLATNLLADMEVQPFQKITKSSRVQIFATYPELKEKVEEQIALQLRIILEKEESMMSTARNRKRKRVIIDDDDGEEKDQTESENKEEEKSPQNTDNLIKVNIRIRENQISVIDDLIVDPNDIKLSNPLFLAESIAKDLNVPYSMINTIAITIAEQLNGLEVDEKVDGIIKMDENAKFTAVHSSVDVPLKKNIEKGVPCAWSIDRKEQRLLETHYQSSTRTTTKATTVTTTTKKKSK